MLFVPKMLTSEWERRARVQLCCI